MAARLRALIACALLCGAATSCIQDDGRRFDPVPGRTRMSVDSEREIGWDFDQKAQLFLPLVTDLEVLEFLDDLGNYMVEKVGDQPFDYRFRIVVSPELNAFAVPGGYIYFHTGTLLNTSDVEELAGVLAHELAHVKGHHHARMTQDTAR
jgi:predicted Zn-dependent protease